jgi:hypothetical protein
MLVAVGGLVVQREGSEGRDVVTVLGERRWT